MAAEEREKIQYRLDARRRQLNDLMYGRCVLPTKAITLRKQIAEDEQALRAIDQRESDWLALKNIPTDEVLQIVMIPLLADVMEDLVAGVNSMLRRQGCTETIFADYVRQLHDTAMKIVDTLAVSEAGLPRLLDVDDTLVAAVEKKLLSFIKRRLNIA